MNMNIKTRTWLLACLLCGSAAVAGSEIHRWVDDDGQVHFGDQPAGAESSEVKPKAAPAGTPGDSGRMDKTRRLLRAYEADRQQEREQKAQQQAQQQTRRRNCMTARDDLRQYSRSGSIYRLGEDGERIYLSEQERDTLLDRYRQAVADWCD